MRGVVAGASAAGGECSIDPRGSIVAAWTAMRGQRISLAVEGVPLYTRAPGAGVMHGVTLTHVLSTGTDGRSYLVPAYHFAETARLGGYAGSASATL